ncbi:hypothetical protein GCM10027202_12210 [Microvirgula curvata]
MLVYKDSYTWQDRGSLLQTARNADEAELFAILRGSTPIDSGVNDDIIADVHHADIHHADNHLDFSDWSSEDSAIENITSPVIEEIDRRASLLGCAYPFSRKKASLYYNDSKSHMYEFCLAISLQSDISSKPWNHFPILFEYASAQLAQYFLGHSSSCYRTGWPPSNKSIRPSRFKDLISILNTRTNGEFEWRPQAPHAVDYSPPHQHVKDEGMDFIAWKDFPDKRLGNLILLGQCACGDDWVDKFEDLNEKKIRQWINPLPSAGFFRVFSVPFHIPGHHVFSHVNAMAGLTFDRVRLTRLAEENSVDFNSKFSEYILKAIHMKLNAFK